jgi:3-phenylpropionate/trans-cinnamate dioxygenase ferredoxin component
VTWVCACAAADLADGVPSGVVLGRTAVRLVHIGGAAFAVHDECTHEAVRSSESDVVNGRHRCWRHGSRFDLATGTVLSVPAVEPVAVFAVRVVASEVLVEVPPGGGTSTRDGEVDDAGVVRLARYGPVRRCGAGSDRAARVVGVEGRVLVGLRAGQSLPEHPGPAAVFHLLDGAAVMAVDEERIEVTAGATFVVPPGGVRGVRAVTDVAFLGSPADPTAEDTPG